MKLEPSQNTYKIGLAGCGKMGASMLRAWLTSNIASQIHTIDPNGLPPELLMEGKITHHANEASFLGATGSMDMLVIALKPQTIGAFSISVRNHLPATLPILSIAAGQTLSSFQARFGTAQPVIRAMPNTPASIGKGMTVACASSNVTLEIRQCAHDLLAAFGLVEWTENENILDAVTAVSGSGPAYVFYLIEALAEAGVQAGLDKDMAMILAHQTIIGSAALAESEPTVPASALREAVTSPNGTTAAALTSLMDGRFQSLINEAVAKATARSKELSK